MLPNFIIVGAPKAGTTSLYHYLSEHPQVFMSKPKEVNFFSKYEIESQGLFYLDFKAKDLNEYEKLFEDAVNKKAVGEGSVSYLFYSETAKKIKEMLPEVKIIILLRNPLERGYSHYLMDYRLGLVDLAYEDIVYKKSNHKNIDLYYQQYVELGFYYKQVLRYLELFGNKQTKIYLQEDLRNNSEHVINDLYDYLKIDKNFIPDINQEHNVFSMPKSEFVQKLYQTTIIRSVLSRFFPSQIKEFFLNILFERTRKPLMTTSTKKYLLELYQPDIEKLEELIGKDLKHWYKDKA